MLQRPQTAAHPSTESPSRTTITVLQLSVNKKLLEQFPKDNHADVTIQVKNKRFELQKAHLRIESPFFDVDKQIISINEYDPDVFEGVLKCIYGGTYQINTYSELYQSYQICSFIKCEGLCKQIENAFLLCKKSFTLAFQLSELYGLEDLRHACYEFLDSNNDAFLQILDIGMLKIKKNHKKTTPTDALGLNNSCFIQLINAHNTYKYTKPQQRKYLSNIEVFQILEMYAEDEDHLKELIITLIDRDTLTSDEYETIYHSIALKSSSMIFEEPPIQKTHQSVKEFKYDCNYFRLQPKTQKQLSDYFEPRNSENYLVKKRMFELQDQNQTLKQEISKLSIALETSMKSTTNLKDSLLETIQQKLDQKLFEKDREIENLKKEIETLKSDLFQKDQTITQLQESERDFNDRESFLVQTTASQFFQEQDMTSSEVQIIKPFTQTLQLSVSTVNKYECDCEPLTLDSQSQLNYVFENLGITIFQQVFLRRQYMGSRDGYDVATFESHCNGVENLLILIRVFDYNKIVGVFFYKNKGYLLNISNQTIEEREDIMLFDKSLIAIPSTITISDECGNNPSYGSTKLTGDKEFQVDEIEAYSVQISHQL